MTRVQIGFIRVDPKTGKTYSPRLRKVWSSEKEATSKNSHWKDSVVVPAYVDIPDEPIDYDAVARLIEKVYGPEGDFESLREAYGPETP